MGNGSWRSSRTPSGDGTGPKEARGDAVATDAVRDQPDASPSDAEANRTRLPARLTLRLKGY